MNPNAGRKAEQPTGSTATKKINYNAVFTGEVVVEPLMFNPSKADLVRLKNLNETSAQYEREPLYKIETETGTVNKVMMLYRFKPESPNDPYKDVSDIDSTYPENMYGYFEIKVDNDLVVSEKTGSSLLIDDKNISCWVVIPEGKTIAEAIDIARKSRETLNKPYQDLDNINPSTARVAKVGEVDLYNLLLTMSMIKPYRKNDKGEEASDCLKGGFQLGNDPSKTFEKITKGDVTSLNDLLKETDGSFFRIAYKDGDVVTNKQCPVGVMLEVAVSATTDPNGIPYVNQKTYAKRGLTTTFSYMAKSRKLKSLPDNYGLTRLDSDACKALIDTEYVHTNKWGDSFIFGEFDKVTMGKVTSSEISGTATTDDDDLPF